MKANTEWSEEKQAYMEKILTELERVLYKDEEDFIEYNNTMGNCKIDKTNFKPSTLTFEQVEWLVKEIVRQDFLCGIRPTITVRR